MSQSNQVTTASTNSSNRPGRHFSVFDYTITLTRKHRYLVVSSPEFGIQIASNYVDLDALSPEEIGMSVLQLIRQMDVRLNQMHMRGEKAPKPLRARGVNALLDREYLSSREAAKVLGVSTATLRKMVKSGTVRAEKTPGGHLRFAIDALAHIAADPTHSINSVDPTPVSHMDTSRETSVSDKRIA